MSAPTPWRLPVTAQVFAELQLPPGVRSVVVVQHLLEDTEVFLELLAAFGFVVRRVYGIEYSNNAGAVSRMRARGLDVVTPPLNGLGPDLRDYLTMLSSKGEDFIVHEVGGYSAECVHTVAAVRQRCVAVVEDTKQGVWRHEKYGIPRLPVYHVAASELKQVELVHVGRAAARALEDDLADLGQSLLRTRVTVLGCGRVGSAVALALTHRGAEVLCWDPDPLQRLRLITMGLRTARREDAIGTAEVIVGASGVGSLTDADLVMLPDGVLLTNVGSRDHELPMVALIGGATRRQAAASHVELFTMVDGRQLFVSSHGCPINFRGNSLPFDVSDLMFAQLAACLVRAAARADVAGFHALTRDEEASIAERWLTHYIQGPDQTFTATIAHP